MGVNILQSFFTKELFDLNSGGGSTSERAYTELSLSNNNDTLEAGKSYLVDTSGGQITLKLPVASNSNKSKLIYVKHQTANTNSTNKVIITVDGGQEIDGSTSESFSLHNSNVYMSLGDKWTTADFSNNAFGRVMNMQFPQKYVQILDDYGFHLTKSGAIQIGDVSVNGSWRIRSSGNYLYFDRAYNNAWQEGIQKVGASVETDNFIINNPSGHLAFRGHDNKLNAMIKASTDRKGTIIGNVDGKVGFMTNGQLIAAIPAEATNTTIHKCPRKTTATFASDTTEFISPTVGFEQDRYSIGITLWSNKAASKIRISLVDILTNLPMVETQSQQLYEIGDNTPSVVIGENKYTWKFPTPFTKGDKYKLKIQTSTAVGWEESSDAGFMAYDIEKRAVKYSNIQANQKIYNLGEEYKRNDSIYIDAKQAGFDNTTDGLYVVLEDFTASGMLSSDISNNKLKKVTIYPFTALSGSKAGGNMGYGNIGINNSNPSEKLDIVGNQKLSGSLYLGNMSTPGVTTNKLYSVNGKLNWNGKEISTGINSYFKSFTNSDLTNGKITINHNLKFKYVDVSISNNSDKKIQPTEITYTNNDNCEIDLSSFGTISGTWNILITGGALVDPNQISLDSKVDKVAGKGLSTNDYTDVAEAKVNHITVTSAKNLDTMKTKLDALDQAIVLKGTHSASGGSFPTATSAGESWIISEGGTIDSVMFEANDRLIAIVDNASTTTYVGNWYKSDTTDKVLSVGGRIGAITLAHLGLNNVDNTSDINKPISTATQTALDGKSDSTHAHTFLNNLRVDGLSYYGDVTTTVSGFLSSNTFNSIVNTATPASGATPETALRLIREGTYGAKWVPSADIRLSSHTNNISPGTEMRFTLTNGYVANPDVDVLTLRADGRVIPNILHIPTDAGAGKVLTSNATGDATWQDPSSSLSLGETSTTAYRGDRGKLAYDHSLVAHAPASAEENVQSDWNITDISSDAYIANKPIVPTQLSQLTEDSTHRVVTDAEKTSWNAKQSTSEKNQANGYVGLDNNTKILATYLPDSIAGGLDYKGAWNANTNTPTMPSAASGNKGHYYKVSVAGTTSVDGINDWGIGDWILSNGSTWDKIDNSETVTSVAGKVGAITLAKGDVGLLNVDNTSDLLKPISTATQTALNGKADTVHTHTNLADLRTSGTSYYCNETPDAISAQLLSSNFFTHLNNINVPTTGDTLQTVLRLAREGTFGAKQGLIADFSMRSRTNDITPGTELVVRLLNGHANNPDTDILTMRHNGEVVPNTLRITQNAGAGRFLTSDANGVASWANIPASGENNVQVDWNEASSSSDAFIKNKPTTLASFTQDAAHRLVTDTEKTAWNGKADSTHTHTSLGDLTVTKLTSSGAVEASTLKVTTGASADKVLTSDASGNATWETPSALVPKNGEMSIWTGTTHAMTTSYQPFRNITIPKTGKYLIQGQFRITSVTATHLTGQLFHSDANDTSGANTLSYTEATTTVAANTHGIVYPSYVGDFDAGDVIYIRGKHSGGTSNATSGNDGYIKIEYIQL